MFGLQEPSVLLGERVRDRRGRNDAAADQDLAEAPARVLLLRERRHEIAEWADDPFVNNSVEPWLTPTAPQYGCSGILETGDPVVAIGFAMGTNTFEQGPNPNGTQSADGYYHPEDEVFLPWFMRTAPNTISEPTQSPSANIGRYTLMGDLNPFPGFRQPATGC